MMISIYKQTKKWYDSKFQVLHFKANIAKFFYNIKVFKIQIGSEKALFYTNCINFIDFGPKLQNKIPRNKIKLVEALKFFPQNLFVLDTKAMKI